MVRENRIHVVNRALYLKNKNQKIKGTRHKQPTTRSIDFLGINRLFDAKHNRIYKVFWLMIIILCMFCCLVQIFARLRNYFEGAITLEVEMKQQMVFNFPSVTICSTNMLSLGMFNNNYNISDFADIYQLWSDVSGIYVRDFTLLSTCFQTDRLLCAKPVTDKMEIRNSTMVYGNCLTFREKKQMQYSGPFTSIDFIWNTTEVPKLSPYFIFYVHNDLLSHVHDGILISEEALHEYVTKFRIYEKELVNLNSRHNPCVSLEEATCCINNCINKVLDDGINCRLSFMTNSTKEQCRTINELLQAFKFSYSVFFRMTEHLEKCKCKRKCKEIKYTLHKDDERKGDNISRLHLLYADDTHTTVTEREIFSASSLFSEIGGSIGLYLGISLFAVADLFESLIRRVLFKLK